MTSAGATLIESPAAATSRPLAGRVLEFLVVGGATLVLFPLAWLARDALGLDASELAVGFVAFHAAHVINDPHFAVTYLLFYKDARRRVFGDAFPPLQRLRYLVSALVVPLALAIWAGHALASHSARSLGWMIQLMFLLVGWHYVKQGFGVLAVLSARQGVSFTKPERRALLAHCYAGWAYAWASPFDPGRAVSEKGVVYTSLAHPAGLREVTFALFLASTLASALVLWRKWRREGRLPPLSPLAGFVVTVWLWTVYSSIDPLVLYVIPALHSLQYLYFVWLMKRNEARAEEGPPHFGRASGTRLLALAATALGLGWILFHGAPSFLDEALVPRGGHPIDESGGLGATPYFAALFAFVNIHHYFMDHVIWRRENPDTRYLRA